MSASIIARSSDGTMHLFADGATTGRSGVLVERKMKIHYDIRAKFAFTYVGDNSFVGDFLDACCYLSGVPNIDVLKGSFVDLVDSCYEVLGFDDVGIPPSAKQIQLSVIGLSPSQKRVIGHFYDNYNHGNLDGSPLPFTGYQTDCRILPGNGPVDVGNPQPQWSVEELRGWAIKAMNAMRGVTFDQYGRSFAKYHAIGFHVQHVSIAPDGSMTDEIIHEWPEDKIGHPIQVTSGQMAPITQPLTVPVPAPAVPEMAAALGLGLGILGGPLGGARPR